MYEGEITVVVDLWSLAVRWWCWPES